MNLQFDVARLVKDFNGVTRLAKSLTMLKKSMGNEDKVTLNTINKWRIRKSISNENLMWIAILSESKFSTCQNPTGFNYKNYIRRIKVERQDS